jgi:hypothetical protein
MTVPNDTIATVRQFQILPLSDEGVGFDHQNLGQHPPGTFTGDFSQGIVNRIRLLEWDNRGISRHGVSLLSGRFWQALTPASIRRLHSTVVTQIPA